MQKYKQLDSGLIVPTSHYDGLVNVVSGLGTTKSKRSHNTWQVGLQADYETLEAVYQSNWIAQAIVDEWAADATREWRTIKSEGAEDIAALEQELCLQQQVEDAVRWARLFGGSGMIMITNQDLEKPLNLNRIKKGSLENVSVFDRFDLTPCGDINTWDIMASNYLRPEYYSINGGSQRIHHSHIALFHGAKLPRRQERINLGWGDSVLRRCVEEISDMVAAKNGVAELLQEVNVDVIKREGLSDDLASDEDDAIVDRYALFSQMKSVVNLALLDGDETLERMTLQLGGVAQVIETFMVWIAGAARMPMTKIFGTSAQGLSATGEGDKKNYYDAIRSQQNSSIGMSMRTLDEVLVRSALGYWPKSFDYAWNPLEQLDGVQVAQARLLDMQAHQMAMQSQLVTRSQVMRVLQANEQYQYNDDELDQLEEFEEGNLFDEPIDLGEDPEREEAIESEVNPEQEDVADSTPAYVRKNGSKWVVYSKDGLMISEHTSKKRANEQLNNK